MGKIAKNEALARGHFRQLSAPYEKLERLTRALRWRKKLLRRRWLRLRRLKKALKMAFRGKYSLTAARQRCSVTSVSGERPMP